MTLRSGMLVVAGFVALQTGSAAAAEPPAGQWLFSKADRFAGDVLQPAAAADAIYLGKTVSFGKDRVDGPGPLACGSATYDYAEMPADGFFQGYAANAQLDAKRFAIAAGLPDPSRTLQLACDTGVFDFHTAEDGELVIMMDLVVYRLQRQ